MTHLIYRLLASLAIATTMTSPARVDGLLARAERPMRLHVERKDDALRIYGKYTLADTATGNRLICTYDLLRGGPTEPPGWMTEGTRR